MDLDQILGGCAPVQGKGRKVRTAPIKRYHKAYDDSIMAALCKPMSRRALAKEIGMDEKRLRFPLMRLKELGRVRTLGKKWFAV